MEDRLRRIYNDLRRLAGQRVSRLAAPLSSGGAAPRLHTPCASTPLRPPAHPRRARTPSSLQHHTSEDVRHYSYLLGAIASAEAEYQREWEGQEVTKLLGRCLGGCLALK